MNQKIEWYKEVLALEPGSRVFFPLARMQAENDLTEDALATLRQGLSRNPEHIEARLLLIDLLFGAGRHDALWPELDQVALMLGGYPGFWSAWNTRLARNASSKDAALALSFFSASLRGEAISWADVIEQGLRQLLGGENVATLAPKVAPPELRELKTYLKDSGTALEASRAAETQAAELEPPSDTAPEMLGRLAGRSFTQAAEADDKFAEEAEDEVFSLKTRSMAEVLAEQGDYAGALEIYSELLRQATDFFEKQELESAIADLSAKAGDNISQAAAHTDDDEEDASPPAGGQGKNRLLDVLDALARRLEARS